MLHILNQLSKLRKLSLNNNPIDFFSTKKFKKKQKTLDEYDDYRAKLIYYLQQTNLKVIDSVLITKKERENSIILIQNRTNKKADKVR